MSGEAIGNVIVLLLEGLTWLFWAALVAGAVLSATCLLRGPGRLRASVALVLTAAPVAMAAFGWIEPDVDCFGAMVLPLMASGLAGMIAIGIAVSLLPQLRHLMHPTPYAEAE